MVRAATLAIAFASGLGLGCATLSRYACLSDDDCDRGGLSGRCLDDGVCAYEDDDCASGERRSPNASVDPGACVPADPVFGTTGGSTSGGAASTDDGDGSSTGTTPDTCGWELPIVVDTAVLTPGTAVDGYPLLLSLAPPELAAALEQTEHEPFVTDGEGEPLAHEWELVDAGRGALGGWVRLPSYEPDELVPVSVRIGVPPPDHDPTSVWADTYVGVWHLGDALTGTDDDPILNSARPGEPGFTGGQMQPEQSVAGVVGGGLAFDGVDDIVTIDAAFVGQLQSYTLSLWARYDGTGEIYGSYFQRLNGDYFYPRCWRLDEKGDGTTICQYELDDGIHGLGTGQRHEVGELIHLALVRDTDAGTTEVYVDGELVGTNEDAPSILPDDGHAFELGHGEWGSYTGMLDELRVSDRALPRAFFDADFRTHRNPASALREVGELRPLPCAGG